MTTNVECQTQQRKVYLVARSPLGPAAPFREAKIMISDVGAFVSFEEPEDWSAPPHCVVVLNATDAGHAAAVVAGRLQENLDIWKHFDVRTRMPDVMPGPSPLFSYR